MPEWSGPDSHGGLGGSPGEVAEWSKANDSKSFEGKPSVGSNPTLSVSGATTGIPKGSRDIPLIPETHCPAVGFLLFGRPMASQQNPGEQKTVGVIKWWKALARFMRPTPPASSTGSGGAIGGMAIDAINAQHCLAVPPWIGKPGCLRALKGPKCFCP
jgi:hypothetical protein